MSVLELECGVQTPRICSLPTDSDYELADDALKWLDQVVGLVLDEWQQLVLRESLAESRPGKWAATEVGLVVARQNGKGAILEARELVGLFLLQEPLLIHSAHQFKTANEHFIRLSGRINDVPELRRRVHQIRTGAGEQGVVLKSGPRLRILARKGGSGRGFSAPFVAFDEAMDLPESTVGDMVPTQSAMPRRQRWYTGSAVDQLHQPDGIVFAGVRQRGIAGSDPRLAFFEWSVDCDDPENLSMAEMLQERVIAAANPGYGIRISREAVEEELNSFTSTRTGAVERYSVGSWPSLDGAESVFDIARWNELADRDSEIVSGLVFMVDTNPARSSTSIVAGGLRADGLPHVEVIDRRPGTGWVVERVVELRKKHKPRRIGTDARGPAASLIPELEQAGVKVETFNATDYAEACGAFFDAYDNAKLRHLGQPELDAAVRGATQRPLGDRWAWDRKNSSVDITSLVAASEAHWSVVSSGRQFAAVAFG